MQVDILGTKYKIVRRDPQKDPELSGLSGYVKYYDKLIVIADSKKLWPEESAEDQSAGEKVTVRHEIIHAFLFESGLWGSSVATCWAINEEMVDWIALQLPKIVKACEDAESMR